MRRTSAIVGSCVLVLLGAVGLVLGCSAGDDGDGAFETVATVEGRPVPDGVEPAPRVAAAESASETQSSAPLIPESAVDPDNDFYLALALEPEPAGTVHIEVRATH